MCDTDEVTFAGEGARPLPRPPRGRRDGRAHRAGPAGGPARCPSIFDSRPNAATWKPVPEAAQQAFGSVETVMKEKIVRRP